MPGRAARPRSSATGRRRIWRRPPSPMSSRGWCSSRSTSTCRNISTKRDWVDGLAKRDRRVLGAVVCAAAGARGGNRAGNGADRETRDGPRRPPYHPEPAGPRICAEARLPRGDAAPAEIQSQLRHLHLPSANAEHADHDAPVSGSRFHPRSHRQARHQGRPSRPLARPHPRDGGAAQCRVQAFRRHHRGRSQNLDARCSSGPTSIT